MEDWDLVRRNGLEEFGEDRRVRPLDGRESQMEPVDTISETADRTHNIGHFISFPMIVSSANTHSY